MAMKFDGQRCAELVMEIRKTQNQGVIEAFSKIASTLSENEDTNQNNLTEQLLDGYKNFQASFNSYVPGTEAIVKDFCSVEEIEEKIKKLDIGDVAANDAGFETAGLDPDAIV